MPIYTPGAATSQGLLTFLDDYLYKQNKNSHIVDILRTKSFTLDCSIKSWEDWPNN